MLMQAAVCDKFSHFRVVSDALADGVPMTMSAETLYIDSMVVGLTSGLIERLAGIAIETLTEGATVCIIVVLLALGIDLMSVRFSTYVIVLLTRGRLDVGIGICAEVCMIVFLVA